MTYLLRSKWNEKNRGHERERSDRLVDALICDNIYAELWSPDIIISGIVNT